MRGITACAGTICVLYYLLISFYAGFSVDFGWFWLALGCAFFLVFASGFSSGRLLPAAGKILLFIVLAGLVLLAAECVPILRAMRRGEERKTEYAIILGAQVRGTRPSKALQKRLEEASSYAKAHPETTLILSGGQGENEDISEAQCMFEYLTAEGLSKERMILEDGSTTTRENLIFSDALTGCAKTSCGIVSNNFHICRALMIAEDVGYTDPVGIPAASDPLMQVHYVVREAAALTVLRGRRIF